MTAQSDQDPSIGTFDQTNGLVEGLEGESDGTAAGDASSEADRENDAPLPLKRAGAAREFGIRITPTDAAGRSAD